MNQKSKAWQVGATAIKTFLVAALGVITINLQSGGTAVNWKTVGIAAVAAGLKAIIKWGETTWLGQSS